MYRQLGGAELRPHTTSRVLLAGYTASSFKHKAPGTPGLYLSWYNDNTPTTLIEEVRGDGKEDSCRPRLDEQLSSEGIAMADAERSSGIGQHFGNAFSGSSCR